MSLKALIATLVLGSSSVALADVQVRDHREIAPVQYDINSHAAATWMRPLPRPMPPTPAPTSVKRTVLANEAKLSGPQTKITINDKKPYTGLELSSDGRGRVTVQRVVVHFRNGTSQTINVNATLTQESAPVRIDLIGNQRYIASIEVLGATRGRNSGLDIVGVKAV